MGPGGGVGPDGMTTDNDDEHELGSDISVPKYVSDLYPLKTPKHTSLILCNFSGFFVLGHRWRQGLRWR